MTTTKPSVANTPEALAGALDLGRAESQGWQVQHALLKMIRQVVAGQSLTHAEVARRAGSSRTRVTAILNGNLVQVSSDLLILLLSGVGYKVKVSFSRRETAA